MDKKEALQGKESYSLYQKITELHADLDAAFMSRFNRSLPLNEEIADRWERAKRLGFGKETSIYDSSMVLGSVKAGNSCWIGPYTVLDGSGGLVIGNYCTISVGAHIYTHDNVRQTLSSGRIAIEREPVTIGNNVYIGPNAVITKGIRIGNNCVIAAFALVNKDVPDNSIVMGQPAVIKGRVEFRNEEIFFNYTK